MNDHGHLLRLLGALLIAVGGLVAVLSGLCSLTFGGAMLVDQGTWADKSEMLLLVLFVGGIPFAVGALGFWAGRRLRRRHPAQPPN